MISRRDETLVNASGSKEVRQDSVPECDYRGKCTFLDRRYRPTCNSHISQIMCSLMA